jgi:serine/threonine-protein kinase
VAAVAAAPQEANEADSGSAAVVDDDLVPLPSAPTATPAKKNPGSRPGKKTSPQVRSKEAQELKNEWTQAKGFFARLTQDQSCESPRLGITCRKFEDLKREVAALGEGGYDKDVHTRVRRMRADLGNLLRSQ